MSIPKDINEFNIDTIIRQVKAESQEDGRQSREIITRYNELAEAAEGEESVLDIIKEYNRDIAYYTDTLKPGLEEGKQPICKIGTFSDQPQQYDEHTSFVPGELYDTVTKVKRYFVNKSQVAEWKRHNTPITGTVLFIYQ